MKNKPDAILTSDWHIRDDRPICRTDDYMKAQEKKINFILNLADEYNCPILIAGDLGHRPMWGDKLLNWFIDIYNYYRSILPMDTAPKAAQIFVILGQHDLLNHDLVRWYQGALGILRELAYSKIDIFHYDLDGGKLFAKNKRELTFTIYPFSYSKPIKLPRYINHNNNKNIALAHTMVIKSQQDKLWPEQKTHSAQWYLKKFPCYDLLVTGDNHQSFAVEYKGRWLVNCGSMMRMTADQINHKPSVYLWYAKENKVERVYLPIEKNVIDRSHIEVKEDHEDKINTFVQCLKDNIEIGFSFDDNLDRYIKKNKPKRSVLNELKESMK